MLFLLALALLGCCLASSQPGMTRPAAVDSINPFEDRRLRFTFAVQVLVESEGAWMSSPAMRPILRVRISTAAPPEGSKGLIARILVNNVTFGEVDLTPNVGSLDGYTTKGSHQVQVLILEKSDQSLLASNSATVDVGCCLGADEYDSKRIFPSVDTKDWEEMYSPVYHGLSRLGFLASRSLSILFVSGETEPSCDDEANASLRFLKLFSSNVQCINGRENAEDDRLRSLASLVYKGQAYDIVMMDAFTRTDVALSVAVAGWKLVRSGGVAIFSASPSMSGKVVGGSRGVEMFQEIWGGEMVAVHQDATWPIVVQNIANKVVQYNW